MTDPSASPVKTTRLYQKVADEITRSIRSGEYGPGERLPAERKLANHFGVARPTVREALIALEIHGLVRIKTGSGVYVTDQPQKAVPPMDLDVGPFELTEARVLIEGETAALAAKLISDDEINELEKVLGEMKIETHSKGSGLRADRRFHVLVAKATKNDALLAVVTELWNARSNSKLYATISKRARKSGIRPQLDEHQAILEALKQRDPGAARQAMHDHLNRTIDLLLKVTELEAMAATRGELEARRNRYAEIPRNLTD